MHIGLQVTSWRGVEPGEGRAGNDLQNDLK